MRRVRLIFVYRNAFPSPIHTPPLLSREVSRNVYSLPAAGLFMERVIDLEVFAGIEVALLCGMVEEYPDDAGSPDRERTDAPTFTEFTVIPDGFVHETVSDSKLTGIDFGLVIPNWTSVAVNERDDPTTRGHPD